MPLDTRKRSSCTSIYWDPAFPHLKPNKKRSGAKTTCLEAQSWRIQFPHLWFSTLNTATIRLRQDFFAKNWRVDCSVWMTTTQATGFDQLLTPLLDAYNYDSTSMRTTTSIRTRQQLRIIYEHNEAVEHTTNSYLTAFCCILCVCFSVHCFVFHKGPGLFLVCSSTQKCSSKQICAVLFTEMCSWQLGKWTICQVANCTFQWIELHIITLCITLNTKTGKIVFVTLCIQIEWLLCNVRLVWNFPTVFIDRRLNGVGLL